MKVAVDVDARGGKFLPREIITPARGEPPVLRQVERKAGVEVGTAELLPRILLALREGVRKREVPWDAKVRRPLSEQPLVGLRLDRLTDDPVRAILQLLYILGDRARCRGRCLLAAESG